MKFNFDDTIAAISTSAGRAGIGIVRISGKESLKILKEIFIIPTCKKCSDSFAQTKPTVANESVKVNACRHNSSLKAGKNIKSHKVNYGFICSNGRVVDEVLATYMKAPRSYTREDVVEISCHGGTVSVSEVLSLVIKSGARLAENGEFTRRALMNGRIDLSQAEAVMDLINAQSLAEGRAAITRLRGGLSSVVREMREELTTVLAHIFVSIDYPEHDEELFNKLMIEEKADRILTRIYKLIETSETGRLLKEGIETVIAGRTNVGKSSLLNSLLNEERAIVTSIPGTTRDFITEYMNFGGIPLRLIDTAGIRETDDEIERIGVKRSLEYLESAELVLFVVDASEGLTAEDLEIYDIIKKRRHIVLVNKSDLPRTFEINDIAALLGQDCKPENVFQISALKREGFEPVFAKINQMFINGGIGFDDEVIISGLRNKTALVNASKALEAAVVGLSSGMTEDFIAIDLQAACDFLGEITGETLDGELLDKIFSEFCLGK